MVRELATEHPLHQRFLHLPKERLDVLGGRCVADQRIEGGRIEPVLRPRSLFPFFE